jgi:hypothetical protein
MREPLAESAHRRRPDQGTLAASGTTQRHVRHRPASMRASMRKAGVRPILTCVNSRLPGPAADNLLEAEAEEPLGLEPSSRWTSVERIQRDDKSRPSHRRHSRSAAPHRCRVPKAISCTWPNPIDVKIVLLDYSKSRQEKYVVRPPALDTRAAA